MTRASGGAASAGARVSRSARGKRHVRRPPDLTSLFDVLFIVVFVALIRAAAAQHEVERLTPPPPPPPRPAPPKPPPPPPEVAALRAKALANLDKELRGRRTVVARISTQVEDDRLRGASIASIELEGLTIPLDVPLLADSHDPDIEIVYQGDASTELRVCRIAAVHLGLPDLAHQLVVITPDRPHADLKRIAGSVAFLEGLERDVRRCIIDQRGIAALIDPADLAPPTEPNPP